MKYIHKKLRGVYSGWGIFVLTVLLSVFLADRFIFVANEAPVQPPVIAPVFKEKITQSAPPARVTPPIGQEYFESLPMEENTMASVPDSEPEKIVPSASVVHEEPQIEAGHVKVAVIIDDVGMDIHRSKRVIEDLPPTITLAMLPYAPQVRTLAKQAKEKGHTLMIHTPMEAMDSNLNIGPGGLHGGMSETEISVAFDKMLTSFDGYEGINNHMGSRLTQDSAAMKALMPLLKKNGLFFVDSKTSGKSIAAQEAAASGIDFAERDVFLDHEETGAFVSGALKKLEQIAKKRGYAIAIGHPKDYTISGLEAWIPTLKAKGIELVSVKELLNVHQSKEHVDFVSMPEKTAVQAPVKKASVKIKASIEEKKEPATEAPTENKSTVPAESGLQDFLGAGVEPAIHLHPVP